MKVSRYAVGTAVFTLAGFVGGVTLMVALDRDEVVSVAPAAKETLTLEQACGRLADPQGAMVAAVQLISGGNRFAIGLDDGLSTKALAQEFRDIRAAVTDPALEGPLDEAIYVADRRAVWLHYPGTPWELAPRFNAAARELGKACDTSFGAVFEEQ